MRSIFKLQEGTLDSKALGMMLSVLGLFPTLILGCIVLYEFYSGGNFGGDMQMRSYLFLLLATFFIIFVTGILLTARASETFLGIVCVLLGIPFLLTSIEAWNDPVANTTYIDPGYVALIGAILLCVGLSKITQIASFRMVVDVPMTENTSLRHGVHDLIKMLGLLCVLFVCIPIAIVAALIALGYVVFYIGLLF